ncbi:sporulation protein YpjB [Pseudalkalibacillus caeni]|uniref:Sporulation protein YpjB n=1 Tax=Exobacillus caeni TaxID=2574798 RepID=A0A5R9F4Z2_9BACL|nr:sporulation protein YpjB [Pseudalkalibacillus caeni]TLS35893.1 sporulation protein YpjB [Pseudalkalibacillus caeni]
MGRIIVLLLLIFSFAFSAPAFANHNEEHSKQELTNAVDQALRFAKEEKFEESKKMLTYFSKMFLEETKHKDSFTMTELRVITTSHDKATEAVTSVSMSLEDRVSALTEFRLAVDALYSDQQPLWKETKPIMESRFSGIEKAIQMKDEEQLQTAVNRLFSTYEMIRPALAIDLSAELQQRLDSHIHFLERYRSHLLEDRGKTEQLKIMKNDFETVYTGNTHDEADPSLVWVILSVGGMIILTLFYVGWKKYRGEKAEQKQKQQL